MAKKPTKQDSESAATNVHDTLDEERPPALAPSDEPIGVTDDGHEVVSASVVPLDEVPTPDLAKLWQQARDDADKARAEADKLEGYARDVGSTLAKRIVDAGKGLQFTVAGRRYRAKRRPEKAGGGYQIVSDEIRAAVALD